MLTADRAYDFPLLHKNITYFLGKLIKKAGTAVKGVVRRSLSLLGSIFQSGKRPVKKVRE